MKDPIYERGAVRLTLGLVGIFGVAGSADQTPLSVHMLPPLALSALIGAWGISRMKFGPTLALSAELTRTARQVVRRAELARLTSAARRRRLLYLRAARR